MGVGLAEGYSAVNARTLRKILAVWLATTPACLTLTCVIYAFASSVV
ncbi:MAG: hypothetical protein QW705_06095 [Zestosphaera sp.]